MKELLISLLNFFGQAWWVEIQTEGPRCIYYFGPFLTRGEAEQMHSGYIEDLNSEGATITSLQIKRCQPQKVTILQEEETEFPSQAGGPQFSTAG